MLNSNFGSTMLQTWPGGSWEASLRILLIAGIIYIAILWASLVFWTFRDIRQRTKDPILQFICVILVLVTFILGYWIYLMLRPRETLATVYDRTLEEETLLQDLQAKSICPSCQQQVREDYLRCPNCTEQLKEPCPTCKKPLANEWPICPFCAWERPVLQQAAPMIISRRRDTNSQPPDSTTNASD
tara:strand:- start:8225 stop:8782 length:558 start_codon:yes stop_codon:yes gene_type:complete